MVQQYISKHVRFTQTHIDIMNDLIENKPGIKNYADAVRYAILSLEDESISDDNKEIQRKINSMSKSIDMLTEMVAGGFHAKDVKAIGKAVDTYIYADAKKNVEGNIQRSTTVKSSSNTPNKTPNKTFSRNFL
ncbi:MULTISPECIES: hypothetical protein [unclassified Bacillus (in: firmicutes)]|uniref:hypothetical protein n=1 Tax=unclassified Bacillus (in: firmicutes) TaxID=185979 RepID=UPI001BE95F4F|nr:MULTISPECIES: hypothetical protein [unclassified Bacillus (in: firmicutes)]MBT2618977.1 hypothetical protein [Bacillus sp. ISL-78]MBT2630639.1 hypothetical protein [Bacillus sp. ISL-101]